MILAIDLGSTSFKAGIYDRVPQLLGKGASRLCYTADDFGDFTLAADAVASGFKACITQSTAAAGIGTEQLETIAITGQAQTFCLTDRRFRPLTPFISWRNTRAAATVEEIATVPPWNEFAGHCSFSSLLTGLQVASLLHLGRHWKLPDAGDFLIMPLHSYLVFMLSGAYVTDDNMAAMTGLFSLSRRDWWPEALAYCGLTTEQLPPVAHVGSAVAVSRQANPLGFHGGINIILAGNDQTAGAYGAEITDSDIYLSMGTAHVAYGIFNALPAVRSGVARGIFYGDAFYRLAVADSGGDDLYRVVHANNGEFVLHSEPASLKEKPQGATRIINDLQSIISQIGAKHPRRLLISGGGADTPGLARTLADITGMDAEISRRGPLDGAAMLGVAGRDTSSCLG